MRNCYLEKWTAAESMKEKSIQVEERKASRKLSLKRLNWIALRQWRLLFSNSKRQHPSYLLEWCRRRRRRGTQRGFNCVALMNKMAAIILSLPLSLSLSLSCSLSLSISLLLSLSLLSLSLQCKHCELFTRVVQWARCLVDDIIRICQSVNVV